MDLNRNNPDDALAMESKLDVDLVVVGQGYVGLPLAQEAVRAGMAVIGFDISEKVVDGLNSGRSHIDDLSDEDIAEMVNKGFTASADETVFSRAKAVVLCVPTPLSADGSPEMKYVTEAATSVADNISAGALVSLESTTYPGTTEDLLRPLFESRGYTIGEDLYLAFSPERINPGDPVYGFRNTPKVVGGSTSNCAAKAEEFYGRLVDRVVPVSGTREAEMTKLLENTYRHINIALVNEMVKACRLLDIDLREAIDAASTKPFGFQAFYPGPGVGGHCIPIDPNYLAYTFKTTLGSPFRFVELAQEINQSMPVYVHDRVGQILNRKRKSIADSTILILGVTYKADIADQRESPARPIGNLLVGSEADVKFHDPHVRSWNLDSDVVLTCVADLESAIESADLILLLQNHRDYESLKSLDSTVLDKVLDTRGLFRDIEMVHQL